MSRLEKTAVRSQIQATALSQKLDRISSWRLTLAAIAFGLLALTSAGFRHGALLVGIFLAMSGFFWLVRVSRKVRYHQSQLLRLSEFAQRQIDRSQGIYENPTPYEPEATHLSADLDLFGTSSVFSQIDETITLGGRHELANWLTKPLFQIEAIQNRQELVRRVHEQNGFFRSFAVNARCRQEMDPFSDEILLGLLQKPLTESNFQRNHILLWILFLSYFISTFLSFGLGLSLPVGALWLAYFLFSMYGLGQIAEVFPRLVSSGRELEKLLPTLKKLEGLRSESLKMLAPSIHDRPLSRSLKSLNRWVDFLSIQAHPVVHVLINGVIPWSFFFVSRAEKQRRDLSRWLPTALKELYQLEALMSLGFVYSHQTSTFPTVAPHKVLKFKNARHPLLPKASAVANDFEFPESTQVALITGSNMSGKSTFLRSVGINQTLALMGAPVFAESMRTSLSPVHSCIRVSDSVRDGTSYFYAEVLRLKEILNEARSGRPILYIIDEMFRGTNNRERLIGSQSMIQALIPTQSFGFISTHDLELTSLTREHREVQNWHFRDEVRDQEIYFTYKIQSGPCPTTNALKIMAAAGIPIATAQPNVST